LGCVETDSMGRRIRDYDKVLMRECGAGKGEGGKQLDRK